jgi:hypothetical protein
VKEKRMPWKRAAFERNTLYAEVWADTVAVVSGRYGLSVARLRTVCKKLAVPLPPKGYWANRRAGKKVRAIQLPNFSGETKLTSAWFVPDETASDCAPVVAEPDEVVRQRTFEDVPANRIVVRADLLGCHHWVTATGKLFKQPGHSPFGLVTPSGGPSLPVTVSSGQVPRALRIWDAILRAAEKRGFMVELKGRQDRPHARPDVVLDVLGEKMYLSIDERVRRVARPLTPEETRRQRDQPTYWLSNRYVYEPTGVLKVSLRQEVRGTAIVQLADKPRLLVERQLHELMVALVTTAVARKATRAAKEEWQKQVAVEESARYDRIQRREKSLKVLNAVESLAERWERAQRLRAFATAIEAEAGGRHGSTSGRRIAHARWIRTRADWLDPLVRAPWPAVDGHDYAYNHSDWMARYAEHERTALDDLLVAEESAQDCRAST